MIALSSSDVYLIALVVCVVAITAFVVWKSTRAQKIFDDFEREIVVPDPDGDSRKYHDRCPDEDIHHDDLPETSPEPPSQPKQIQDCAPRTILSRRARFTHGNRPATGVVVGHRGNKVILSDVWVHGSFGRARIPGQVVRSVNKVKIEAT
jgi:hypothetical protein